ncbi:MAG: DNA polymerase III subunit delta' [Pseudomonadota bacterium]
MSTDNRELLPWHESQWRHWQQYVASGTIPHALLLTGPSGLGKQQFAHRISRSLLCSAPLDGLPCGQCQDCRLMPDHPDVHLIQPDQQFIRVAAIRDMIHTISLASRTWRIFVLRPADTLHPAAANALLKTLEEPTPNTLLILLSALPHRLPATIRSRCQILAFQPATTTQAKTWLQQQQAEIDWEPLLALSGQAPLAALAALESDRAERIQALVESLTALSTGHTQPMQLVSLWAKQPFGELLNDFTVICYDMVRLSAGYAQGLFLLQAVDALQSLSAKVHLTSLLRFIEQLNRLKRQQQVNLNTSMCVEALVSSWLALILS